jgi:hypothetical protein
MLSTPWCGHLTRLSGGVGARDTKSGLPQRSLEPQSMPPLILTKDLWHDPAHVLVGIFAGGQPKPFGVFLTQSSHSGVTQSSTTQPGAGHE